MKKIILILCTLLFLSGCNYNKKNVVEPINEEQKIEKVEEQSEKRMSLVAVGDALIHDAIYLDAYIGNNNYDFSNMFEYIEPMISQYDLKYYNQESIIGGKNLGVSNYPRFNSPDEIGSNLLDIGFNMVSLANNHSYDKGEEAINYSVNFWNSKNIIVNGQSNSFEERNNIKIYEQNGIKFAFLSYTDGINGLKLPNGKEYLVNIYSEEQVKLDIDSIRDKVDVIIVAMHWGVEYTHVPTEKQKNQAKYLSSLGVNLILGSHPHVIMPVSYVDDTLVVYSLGNFISSQGPLGIDKIIGLMVGMDIVLKDKKVTFEDIDYNLLYTYSSKKYTDFKIIPFDKLTDDILKNHENIGKEYMNIVTSEVKYD